MTNVSIHPTTRVPFLNATLTARQLSGSTTPVKFHTATGEDIGLAVKTNARGFICSSDGTPYVDGVFVSEDSLITATLGDGSSTSWVVVAESDISAFDGVLYGRKLLSGESTEGAVKVGNEWYKRLFSANQPTDGQLSYLDIADTPGFTKWSEDQQIEVVDFSKVGNQQTILMSPQTKTLMLIPKEGTTPPDSPFKVTLQATLDQDGHSRFGRNFSVANFTPKPLLLANATYDKGVFGRVGIYGCVMVCELYPDARPGMTYGGEAAFRMADPHRVDFDFLDTGSYDEIKIRDDSPEVVVIETVHNAINGTRTAYVVPLDVTIPRTVTVKRGDTAPGSLTLVERASGAVLTTLPPSGSVQLCVGTNAVWALDNNHQRGFDYQTKLSTAAGAQATVPIGCTVVGVDCSNATDQTASYELRFDPWDTSDVRVEFTGAPKSVWIVLTSNGLTTRVSIPKGDSRICVNNTRGVLTVTSRSWLNLSGCSYSKTVWSANVTTLQCALDFGEINAMCDTVFGNVPGSNTLELKLPVDIGQGTVELDVPSNYFMAVGGAATFWYLRLVGSNGKRLVADAFGSVLTGYEKVDIGTEPAGVHGRLVSSQRVRFKVTSEETDVDNFTDRSILQRSSV